MEGFSNYPHQPYQVSDDVANVVSMSGTQDAMDPFDMAQAQSLDDIVAQNDKASRRRSMPLSYGSSTPLQMDSPDSRRLSMMNFGDPSMAAYGEFQFNMRNDQSMEGVMASNPTYPQTSAAPGPERSGSDLAINTQFANQNAQYSNMPPPGSAFASPLHPNNSLDMDLSSPYHANMSMPLNVNDQTLAMMNADMNMFTQAQFHASMMESPVNQEFLNAMAGHPQDRSVSSFQNQNQFMTGQRSSANDTPSSLPSRNSNMGQDTGRSTSRSHSSQSLTPQTSAPHQSATDSAVQSSQHDVPVDAFKQMKFPWTTPPGGFPTTMTANPHVRTQFKNAYSSSGFDLLGVLSRIAHRPNAEIDIGPVDLSCAFVVCDATMDDQPIVYCSEIFERLTGYNKHMILGRNCRFLQSPDGKVEAGVKRKYVDDESVRYLKRMILEQREAQISLINYRRGGQPFMNLLTMIPIAYNSEDIRYFVGFQVDLVEQPGSMQNKNPDGSYHVNYSRGLALPSYIFNPEAHRPHPELGQTISKDEVSNVLTTYGISGDSEITRRVWDKVLLENTDDVIHVLSLKGLFLYLSPSSNKVLEYDPSELVGAALSSICHPSDIVPVTRELKETGNTTSINIVFRIRRKKSGYMWFEGHGSLHTEQGKGRKCIILVGRERPVYTLSKGIVRESGGIGDNELWTKMSTSGMFLFVSSNVRQLLDKQPEDLVGTSIQALMRPDSKVEFGKVLEAARGGRKGEVKHEMLNKRGQVLQAYTTIYPGDATEGQKPTFVVGQTRLLKYKSSHGHRPSIYAKKERHSGDSQGSLASATTVSSQPGSQSGRVPQIAHQPEVPYQDTGPAVTTFSGHNALALGRQDLSLASEDNVFDELKTTRSTSWQYELRQMEKRNRYLAEEVQSLLAAKKKRKRRRGDGKTPKDCANCHTTSTPEWRRGPSGNRDLCNSCGLRWAKQNGRVSPRASSQHSAQSEKSKKGASPRQNQPILPNKISETGGQSSIPSTLAMGMMAGKRSPQQQSSDSHAAKVARMEVAALQGLSGGIPPKIDEGVEPIEDSV